MNSFVEANEETFVDFNSILPKVREHTKSYAFFVYYLKAQAHPNSTHLQVRLAHSAPQLQAQGGEDVELGQAGDRPRSPALLRRPRQRAGGRAVLLRSQDAAPRKYRPLTQASNSSSSSTPASTTSSRSSTARTSSASTSATPPSPSTRRPCTQTSRSTWVLADRPRMEGNLAGRPLPELQLRV